MAKKRSKKEQALLTKLNKLLKNSDRNIAEITLKPRTDAQKFNDAVASAGFKDKQVAKVKLGMKKKKCLQYKAVYDSNGNFIGLACVKWG